MKTLLLFPALFLVGSSVLSGQTPPAVAPRQHSVALTAESGGAGGGFSEHRGSNLQGNVLSDKRVEHSGESVNITVRNLSPQPDNVWVEWYFVADRLKKHGGTSPDYIFDQGSKNVALEGSASQQLTANSKEIATKEKKTEAIHHGKHHETFGRTQESGSKVRGWFVRVKADNRVIAAKGSSQEYEDAARDDAKLKALAER